MTTLDRIAWWCSRVAPVGWCAAIIAILLEVLLARAFAEGGARPFLPVLALGAALLGLAAHTVLGYHVLKCRAFSEEERNALWRNYLLGFGYSRWRETMRRHAAS